MASFSTYLFVHIPKTAGTSFRQAVQQAFPGRVVYDYGPDSPITSPLIRDFLYPNLDLDRLRQRLAAEDIAMLGGHFHYERYAALFPPEQVITFIRDPVARTVSEYQHLLRRGESHGTLLEFARQDSMRNRQTALLRGASLPRLKFVGVTECYEASLAALKAAAGWDLEALTLNTNPSRTESGTSYALSDAEFDTLTELNALDISLHSDAKAVIQGRLSEVLEAPRNYELFGALGSYKQQTLGGWAVRFASHEALRIRILVNGQPATVVSTSIVREDVRLGRAHRSSKVGFRAQLGQLASGTEIRAFVEGTDFELRNSPLLIK